MLHPASSLFLDNEHLGLKTVFLSLPGSWPRFLKIHQNLIVFHLLSIRPDQLPFRDSGSKSNCSSFKLRSNLGQNCWDFVRLFKYVFLSLLNFLEHPDRKKMWIHHGKSLSLHLLLNKVINILYENKAKKIRKKPTWSSANGCYDCPPMRQ